MGSLSDCVDLDLPSRFGKKHRRVWKDRYGWLEESDVACPCSGGVTLIENKNGSANAVNLYLKEGRRI